jgi:hypothetical protein
MLKLQYRKLSDLISSTVREFYLDQQGCVRSIYQKPGTWEPPQNLLEGGGKPRKSVPRWPVAGLSGPSLLASSPANKIIWQPV